jgi:hypothetical protein
VVPNPGGDILDPSWAGAPGREPGPLIQGWLTNDPSLVNDELTPFLAGRQTWYSKWNRSRKKRPKLCIRIVEHRRHVELGAPMRRSTKAG